MLDNSKRPLNGPYEAFKPRSPIKTFLKSLIRLQQQHEDGLMDRGSLMEWQGAQGQREKNRMTRGFGIPYNCLKVPWSSCDLSFFLPLGYLPASPSSYPNPSRYPHPYIIWIDRSAQVPFRSSSGCKLHAAPTAANLSRAAFAAVRAFAGSSAFLDQCFNNRKS